MMKNRTFMPSDLLIPKECDLTRWAVIASDQFNNAEDYWQKVEEFVGREPSALRLTLPESCLDGPEMETDIMSVNGTMSEYLRGNRFETLENALIYVERSLDNGKIRKGIVGVIDLEEFDHGLDPESRIRPSEATSLLRLPPRVAARKNAPLEVSHVVLLADDPENRIFQGISKEKPLYDVDLMAEGGNVKGWLLTEADQERVLSVTDSLGNQENDKPILQFAIGDGHHSLVSAKESYERQKKFVHEEDWATLPARFAMVELVNLHDDGVELNAFYPVISAVDSQEFLRDFRAFVEELPENQENPQEFHFSFGDTEVPMTVKNPLASLEVVTLQKFLEKHHPKAMIEYFYDKEKAKKSAEKANTVCILLPDLNKKYFFKTLMETGILPEKSFTLGHRNHKRYYLEARKIR